MQVQVNTDHNIEGRAALTDHITSVVETTLKYTSHHITRVEVHLSDENSDKKDGADAIRCTMEARLEGRPPLVVTYDAATVHQAVDGAVGKLARMIDSTLDRERALAGRKA